MQFLFVPLIILHSYFMNILITGCLWMTVIKLKCHFTLKRFFSMGYYPFLYWFTPSFFKLSFKEKCRHLMVLILTSFVYVISFFNLIEWSSFVHFIMFTFLIISLFTDMEHQIIPNELSFGLLLIAILYSFYTGLFFEGVQGLLLALGVFVVIAIVASLFGQPQPFGAGDIKLCLGLGIWGWKITGIVLYLVYWWPC